MATSRSSEKRGDNRRTAAVLVALLMLVAPAAPVVGAASALDAGTASPATGGSQPDLAGQTAFAAGLESAPTLSGDAAPAVSRPESPAVSRPESSDVPQPESAPDVPPANRTNVTLITGQTVQVVETGGERRYDADADEPMHTVRTPDGTYVFPDGVDFDRFDPELFNVDRLIEDGYADDESGGVPVIVQEETDRPDRGDGAGAVGLPNASERPGVSDAFERGVADAPGFDRARAHDSVGAISGRVDKAAAERVFETLRADDSVERVHYDAKYHVQLDDAGGIVSADDAWGEHNATGEGVTVAVLDTGVDSSHPDLQDAVVHEKDFTGEGTADDSHGHGTHVAGIVAGRGNASDGTYVGVAPDADVMNLRVLGSDGYGSTSDIIEAMEYADANGADVISMSLGGSTESNDPFFDAVDAAVGNGTTVVVAAGNDGSDYETIGSPGVVPSAVTVGASDDSDDIAYFSSRGPTPLRDYTKPDLVAPGYSIKSAEAGTDGYTSKSGTSMATPVVAGGAALVIEAGGDPTPTEVKSRLVTTTDDIGAYDVYTAGSGRLNASRAIGADLVVDRATTDFGSLSAGETERRTLRIENVGENPRTVNVSASATSLDGNDGTVAVNRTQLTLDPGQTADVALEVTADSAQGTYSGRVRLDEYSANFGYLVDAKYSLTVEKSAIDSTDVGGDTVFVHDHDRDGATTTDSISATTSDGSQGETSLGVLDGNYTVYTAGIDESTGQPVIMGKQVTVTGSTTLTFDESETVTYSLDASDPESVDGNLDALRLHGRLGTVDGTYTYYQMWRSFPDDRAVRFSAGAFNASVAHLLAPADDYPNETRHLDTPTAYHLFHQTQGVTGDETFVVDRSELAAENVTYYRDSSGQTYDLERVVDNPVLNDPIGTGQWSLRDRGTQTVYSTPGDGATQPSYRLELADDDGDWTIRSANGYAPAGGVETRVTANQHPFTGTASVDVGNYADRDDVSLFVNPQVSQPTPRGVLETSDATTDYTVTRDGSVVEQGQTDGPGVSYSADGTVSEGTTYEIVADADNGDRSLSTRTRTAVRTTYAEGGDNAPPSVEAISAPKLSAQSSLPTGPVGVDVTVDDDDLENVTVLVRYADGTVTSEPYGASLTDTDAEWHDASVTAVDAQAGEYRATIDTDLGTDAINLEVAVLDGGGNAVSTAAYDAFAVDGRDAGGVIVSSATLSNSTIAAGETAEATATVENTGDATADFDAEFRLTADGTASTVATRTVTLDPGESRTVTLSGTVSEAGTYDADVSGEPAGQLTVEGPAVFELSGGSLNATEITAGESVEATATVENTGGESGTFTAELAVNGTVESTADVTLSGGKSTTVSFEYAPPQAGDYALSIAGDAGDGTETATDAGTLSALEPASFAVSSAALEDAEILTGETTAATATVENVGEAEGTFTVELTADDGSGVEVRNETDVVLAGGDSTTVRLASTFQSAGEYAVAIGGEHAGNLTVSESDPAAFQTSGVTLDANPILEGDAVTVAATVENVGDEAGEHAATLSVDGTETATRTVSLAGGESTTVSFTETFGEAGDYAITVDDAAPVTLTVDRPATFDVHDPRLNETTILEGETVALTADVENVGDREGTYTAEFRTGNQVLDERDVALGAGTTETVTLEATFEEAGEYGVSFTDADAGTLTVEQPATFSVTNADTNVTQITTGESVGVSATIANTGDRAGTFGADLEVDGAVVETQSVEVAAGSTETVTFDRGFDDAGEYDVAVSGTVAGTVTVTEPDPAQFQATGVTLSEDPILEGESVTVEATVENVGEKAGQHTATLSVDGTETATRTVSLDGGTSTTVSFTETFADAGEYDVSVDDASPATLSVEQPATVAVTDASLGETEILTGESVGVTATVENGGDREGNLNVDLQVDGEPVNSTTVTVAGGESVTVSFRETFADAGSYDLAVDGVDAGTLVVGEPASAEFRTRDVVVESPALVDEPVEIRATVENVGDGPGEHAADLFVDGENRATESVSLGAGETTTVSFTESFAEAGEYSVEVDDAGPVALAVEANASLSIVEATLSEAEISEGENATVEATVENVGDREGTKTYELRTGNETLVTEDVTVAPGATTNVSFAHAFETPGDYELFLEDRLVGNITVLTADDGTGGGDDAGDDGGNVGGAPGGGSSGGAPGGGSSGGAPGGGSSGGAPGGGSSGGAPGGGGSPGLGGPPGQDGEPNASGPSVSVDRSTDGSTISVTNASPSKPVDVDLDTGGAGEAGGAGDGESFVHSGLQLDLGQGAADFELAVSPPAGEPAEAPEPADHRAIGYVRVEKSGIGNEDIEEARFEFAVNESDLPEGTDPEDVRMLRYHDGEWQELETEHEGGEAYTAVSPGFSEFAVAVDGAEASGEAVLKLADAEVADRTVPPGGEVTATATIENVGDANGTRDVGLAVDGEVVESTEVALAPNASSTVSLSTSLDESGTYQIGFAGANETVTVSVEPESTPATDGDGAGTPTGSDDGSSDATGGDGTSDATGGDGPSDATGEDDSSGSTPHESIDGTVDGSQGDGGETDGGTDDDSDEPPMPIPDLPRSVWIASLLGMVLVAVLVNLVAVGPELLAPEIRGAESADGRDAESPGGSGRSPDAKSTDGGQTEGPSEFDWVGSD